MTPFIVVGLIVLVTAYTVWKARKFFKDDE
jgi:hypothetical protein